MKLLGLGVNFAIGFTIGYYLGFPGIVGMWGGVAIIAISMGTRG